MSTYLLKLSDAERVFGSGYHALADFGQQDANGHISIWKAISSERQIESLRNAMSLYGADWVEREDLRYLGDRFYQVRSIGAFPSQINQALATDNISPLPALPRAEHSITRSSASVGDVLSAPIDISLSAKTIVEARKEALAREVENAALKTNEARRALVEAMRLQKTLKAEFQALEESLFRNLHKELSNLVDLFVPCLDETPSENQLPVCGYSYLEELPSRVMFTTHALTCQRASDGALFSIGVLDIYIDFDTSDIIIRPSRASGEPSHARRSHPALSQNGQIANQEIWLALSEMVLNLQITDLLRVIIDILTRIPEGDPNEKAIEEWPRIEADPAVKQTLIIQDNAGA